MGLRDLIEFLLRFGERDIQALFALVPAFHEELQAEGRLSHAGITLDKIDAMRRQPAIEDIVQSFDSCRAANG